MKGTITHHCFAILLVIRNFKDALNRRGKIHDSTFLSFLDVCDSDKRKEKKECCEGNLVLNKYGDGYKF